MELSEAIRSLRDRALDDLIRSHDYYSDTKSAWRLVRALVKSGYSITIRNTVTGTETTQSDLATKSRDYVTEQLSEATFQQFLSIFENFYFELLRLWLTAYPQSLGKKTVDFKSILELPDKEAITHLVVRKELNEVLFDRPSEWFHYLQSRINISVPSADEIERISEAKATWDVVVHNRGIANNTYLSKAGKLARFLDGERVEIGESYHRSTWNLLAKIIADVSDASIVKASSSSRP